MLHARWLLVLLPLLAGIAQVYFPWYSLLVVGLLLGVLAQPTPWRAFGYGLLGALLLWGGYAAWINWQNQGMLADRMGTLFGGMGPWTMVGVSALIGGLFGGLSVLTGNLGRRLFVRPTD